MLVSEKGIALILLLAQLFSFDLRALSKP
jgi:hypothetical protein